MNYKDRLMNSFPIFSQMLKRQKIQAQLIIAGGAAGDLSVAGIKKGDDVIGALKLPSIEQVAIVGGAAGDLTVTGIATTDRLVSVINLTDGVDYAGEFTITAANTINNAGGTSSAADQVQVTYERASEDLASEFSVVADGVINNAGGTASTGFSLLVMWTQWAER